LNVRSLIFFALFFIAGCTGFNQKSQGNGEGFAGAAPLPGVYYAIDTRVACAIAPDAITGFQAVVEVKDGQIRYRGACEATLKRSRSRTSRWPYPAVPV